MLRGCHKIPEGEADTCRDTGRTPPRSLYPARAQGRISDDGRFSSFGPHHVIACHKLVHPFALGPRGYALTYKSRPQTWHPISKRKRSPVGSHLRWLLSWFPDCITCMRMQVEGLHIYPRSLINPHHAIHPVFLACICRWLLCWWRQQPVVRPLTRRLHSSIACTPTRSPLP